MHMLSTITGAEEIYKGNGSAYKHKDELWIWIPGTEPAVEHLKSFLNSFKSSPQVVAGDFEIELLGDNAKVLRRIFTESFLPVPIKENSQDLPIAILRFRAGVLNSRKAMVSPCLPNLVYAQTT